MKIDSGHIFNDRYSLEKLPFSTPSCPRFPADRMVSIGSCFARNLDRWLRHHGCGDSRSNYPWGIFYNPFSINGEIQRLLLTGSNPEPVCDPGELSTKQVFSDPWRSWLTADNQEQLRQANAAVDASAQQYLAQPSALLVTLGLTEVWFNRQTPNIIFNQVPNISNPAWKNLYGSRFAAVDEIANRLIEVVSLMRKKFGASLPIVLTLSPVPLKYTASGKSVQVANSLSKATLRIAIEEVCGCIGGVDYFPAYEIVHALLASGKKTLQEDGRHVTALAVDTVVRSFLEQHCTPFSAPSDNYFFVPRVDRDGRIIGKLFLDGSVTLNED